jgi:apolipoprotein N-acyltransferase
MAYAHGEKRADVFVNISNDGWFGESAADRRLHAQIARFRCIENRIPMVRCVNTGVSMHVNANGRVIATAGDAPGGAINQPASVLANVQVDDRVTLYGRIGGVFPMSCLTFALIMLLSTYRFRRKSVDPGVVT